MATGEKRARVLYEYQADGDNQLSIAPGDVITVIGSATSENWILARKNGEEGYIPDEYFEYIGPVGSGGGTSSNSGRPAGESGGGSVAAAASGGKYARGGSTSHSTARVARQGSGNSNQRKAGSVLNEDDVYNVFAYQLEWATIVTAFIVSLISFMYGSTQPYTKNPRIVVCGFFALMASIITIFVIGYQREIERGPSPALMRMLPFTFILIFLAASYPIGLFGVMPLVIVLVVELMVYRKQCRSLPLAITNDWGGQFFGGLDDCTSGRLITFFWILAIDVVAMGWGVVDGYDRAEKLTDRLNDYDIRPVTFGVATGFGRIVSINMALLLIFMCHGCFSRSHRRHVSNRTTDTVMGRCCSFLSEDARRVFLHRVLAYFLTGGAFLHAISSYYAYELSGQTRSYTEAFGIESYVTGGLLLTFLTVILGSANESIKKQYPMLFTQTHLVCSVLMMLLLFFHGRGGLGRSYWMFGIIPTVFYIFDLAMRAVSGEVI